MKDARAVWSGLLVSVRDAAEAAEAIAGGAEIYALAMPLADRILLTRVHATFPDADAHFRGFEPEVWNLTSAQPFPQDEKHAFAFTIQRWERKRAASSHP